MKLLEMMSYFELASLLVAFLLAFVISAVLSRGIRRRLTTSSSLWVTFLLGNYVFGWIYGALLIMIGFGLVYICGPSGMCILILFGYLPVLVVAGILGLLLFFVSLKIFPIKQTIGFFTRPEGYLLLLSCLAFLVLVGIIQRSVYEERAPLSANISATLDSGALLISSPNPTFSGTASGIDTLKVRLDSGRDTFFYQDVSVINGRWSVTTELPQNVLLLKKPIFISVYVERSKNTNEQLIRSELTISNPLITESFSPTIKIVSPNGGETLKIGRSASLMWESGSFPMNAQLDAELFEISGDQIVFNDRGACTNCIGGGLRSGISALSPVVGGTGTAEWQAGITYSGEKLKPGSHYVMKVNVSKTGTYENGECLAQFPTCTVDLGTDWSDGVFTLVE